MDKKMIYKQIMNILQTVICNHLVSESSREIRDIYIPTIRGEKVPTAPLPFPVLETKDNAGYIIRFFSF